MFCIRPFGLEEGQQASLRFCWCCLCCFAPLPLWHGGLCNPINPPLPPSCGPQTGWLHVLSNLLTFLRAGKRRIFGFSGINHVRSLIGHLDQEAGELLLFASKLGHVACAQRRAAGTRLNLEAQVPPDWAVVRALHLWHDVHTKEVHLSQGTVSEDVVNARAIVGLAGSGERAPAGESLWTGRVEEAEGVDKLPAALLWLPGGVWIVVWVDVLFLLCAPKQKPIEPLPTRVVLKIVLREERRGEERGTKGLI